MILALIAVALADPAGTVQLQAVETQTVQALEAVGVVSPTVSELGPVVSGPLESGGWVRQFSYESPEAAAEDFAARVLTTVQVDLPEYGLEGADQAVGDGTGILIFRVESEIVVVRSTANMSGEIARGLVSRLRE